MFPEIFCHLQFYVLIFLCYVVDDIVKRSGQKQICNEFKKMNDTFKIKKHDSTVLLPSSVLCTYIIHDIAEKYERIELTMTEEPSKHVFFILKVSFISRNIFKVALQSTLQGFGYYICIYNFSLGKFLSQSTRQKVKNLQPWTTMDDSFKT